MAIILLPLILEEQLSFNSEIKRKLSTGKLHPGGLPRNSLLKITDHPDMTSAVYHCHKATNQNETKVNKIK